MLGNSFAVLQVQMVWCACQNTLRRSLEPAFTFLKFLWHVSRHFPSVRAESKLWLMSTQAVLHWEWEEAALPYLLCYRLFWLHQGTLWFALGQTLKWDLGGFLLLCSQTSSSPYHWVIIQISLWKPLETGTDSTTALLTGLYTWHLLLRGTGSMCLCGKEIWGSPILR